MLDLSAASYVIDLGEHLVGQTCSPGTMQNSSANDRMEWNLRNLEMISKSEKVNFQIVTERNYAIWWLNMFKEGIPKSRDTN